MSSLELWKQQQAMRLMNLEMKFERRYVKALKRLQTETVHVLLLLLTLDKGDSCLLLVVMYLK